VAEIEAHLHRYRSPLAAIVGLAESCLERGDLDPVVIKQLRAIRALALDALEAEDARRGGPLPGENRSG
jgi:hypothetical protein